MSTHTLLASMEVLSGMFAALTAIRTFRFGLNGRYRFLFAYLVFLVPYNIYPVAVDLKSKTYFWVWVITEPITWAFEICVVRELCGLVLEQYRGLCTIGRWVMYIGVAVSAAVSLVSLLLRIPSSLPQRSRLLYYWYAGDRGVHLALALFLLLMILAASRYPVPLCRNVVLNATMFTLLFFGTTLASLLRALFDLRVADFVNLGLTMASTASLAIWFFFLTPAGEKSEVELARFRPDHEQRILQRLDEFNRFVLDLT